MFYDTEDLKDGEIQLRLERTAEGNPEKNWVPAYYFGICLADGTRIGQCDGYRGHRYAAKACRLLFRQARKHGLGYVIITCDPTNTASSRTCELADGEYLETADIPEDHDMYERGLRQVMVYRFDLDRGGNEDGTN